MLSPLRRLAFQLFWHLHRLAYRLLGARATGDDALVLRTVGRNSAEPRETLLSYLPDGERYVVIGSNAGADRHPAWWLNLQARPYAEIELRGRAVPVRAGEAEGAERERLWARIVEWNASYADYARRTERRIPVVILEPAKLGEGRMDGAKPPMESSGGRPLGR